MDGRKESRKEGQEDGRRMKGEMVEELKEGRNMKEGSVGRRK